MKLWMHLTVCCASSRSNPRRLSCHAVCFQLLAYHHLIRFIPNPTPTTSTPFTPSPSLLPLHPSSLSLSTPPPSTPSRSIRGDCGYSLLSHIRRHDSDGSRLFMGSMPGTVHHCADAFRLLVSPRRLRLLRFSRRHVEADGRRRLSHGASPRFHEESI